MPTGTLKGPDAIEQVFRAAFSEFAKPRRFVWLCTSSASSAIMPISYGNAETADNFYDAAMDTFVVRNGKIVAQSFAAKITPKS